jgi:hypothetical protein
MMLFLISEITCGVEVWVLLRSDNVMAAVHCLASGISAGLFFASFFLFLDKTVFHLTEVKACIGRPLCRTCTAGPAGDCKMNPLFVMVTLFVLFLTVPPLMATVGPTTVNLSQYTLPFEEWNRWFDVRILPWIYEVYPEYDPTGKAFTMPEIQSLLDYRILPAAAAVAGVGRHRLRSGYFVVHLS